MSTVDTDTNSELKGLDAETQRMVVNTVKELQDKLLTKEKVLEWDLTDTFPEDVIRELLSPEIGLQLLFLPGSPLASICSVLQFPFCLSNTFSFVSSWRSAGSPLVYTRPAPVELALAPFCATGLRGSAVTVHCQLTG